jgi:protein-disulfide isomerase
MLASCNLSKPISSNSSTDTQFSEPSTVSPTLSQTLEIGVINSTPEGSTQSLHNDQDDSQSGVGIGTSSTVMATIKPEEKELNLGDPNAPVKVVEFADFQCPYCQLYWKQTEPTIISTYIATKKVYYTYSPMAFIGQESILAAEAAYCANDQSKFWEYHDYIFSNQTGENSGDFTQTKLITFAKNLNLDVNTFESCLNSGKYATKVDEDNTYAAQQGVNSTPSFVINGKIYSSSDLQQAIEDALNGK